MKDKSNKTDNPNKTLSSIDKVNLIKDATDLFSDGVKQREVAYIMTEKYGRYIPFCSSLLKQAKHNSISNYVVPEKEHFYKDSLIQYESINDELSDMPERDKAVKLQLQSIKDRNELLGLSKSEVTVEINFNSDNYSEQEFLKDRNAVESVEVESEKVESEEDE